MRKGDRTREVILDQAIDLASVVGVENMSIGALATSTGLSKSGLFAHFGSKAALEVAVIDAAAERFLDQVVRPVRRRTSGLARLSAYFENWIAWIAESGRGGGCPLVAAAVELDDRPGPARDRLVQLQQQWLDALARLAGQAVELGEFRADLEREQFAHDLHAIILGYHNARRLLRDPRAERRVRQGYAALVAAAARRGAARQAGVAGNNVSGPAKAS